MNKFDISDGRHFQNEYKDYSVNDSNDVINNLNKIDINFKKFLITKIIELTSILDNKLSDLSSKDVSIYTGLSGIAYFYFHLSESQVVDLGDIIKTSRKTCISLIERCLRHLRNRPGSFLCDDTGPMTMAVILDIDRNKFMEIMSMAEYIINDTRLPNEMLYGRSGYLFSLLFLQKHRKEVSKDLIKKVFYSIVQSGRESSNCKRKDTDDIPALFYEWHDKPYLGAAHGMAGIMFMLLQVYLEPSLHDLHNEIKQDINKDILSTIQYLTSCRLPSGNYSSSLGESAKRDTLVHWCHGAPGCIHMFIAAHKVYNDIVFLERATEIAEVIWNRGLLNKGCGICHGSAGNGFAFLAIYQHTNDLKYLYRALKFAEWCTDCFKNRTREADRPWSLFEGLSGTIYFLLSCLDPKNSKFPAYEL